MIEVKTAIGHGRWLPWLEVEFGWTDRTALNFMRVAEMMLGKSETVSDLPIDASALYLLAAPKVPKPAVEAAIERAEAGEHITKAEAERMIAARPGMRPKSTAQQPRERGPGAEHEGGGHPELPWQGGPAGDELDAFGTLGRRLGQGAVYARDLLRHVEAVAHGPAPYFGGACPGSAPSSTPWQSS